MRKILLTTLLLLFSLKVSAQEISWNEIRMGGSRIYQSTRLFISEYDPLYKEPSLVEFTVLPDGVFQEEVSKYTKADGVYAMFYLPINSDKTFIYVKKSCVTEEYVRNILFIKDRLYVTHNSTVMQRGLTQVYIETDSLGGHKRIEETRQISAFNNLQIIGSIDPVIIINNGFYKNRFPHLPNTWVERISKDKESRLFLADKK